MLSSTLTLYHGTSRRSAEMLVTHGWSPHSGSKGSQCGNPQFLYLTNHPENALWYSEQKGDNVVLKIEVPRAFLKVDPDDGTHATVENELEGPISGSVVLCQSLSAEAFSVWQPIIALATATTLDSFGC